MDINAIKSDVFSFLEKSKVGYDLIFADPPYELTQEQFERIVKIIETNELLLEGGMLVIEHSPHTSLEPLENFSFAKKYGSSIFSFFTSNLESETDSEEE